MKVKMATSEDTTYTEDLESDSEYLDAEPEFPSQPVVNHDSTEINTCNIEPPHPIPPPRTKRKQSKKNQASTTPRAEISGKLSLPTDEQDVDNLPKQELHDPFVTIKEEGLLMNPELLQNSEVTVTSETPLKSSGRANECQPGEIVILSDGDSADEESKLHPETSVSDQSGNNLQSSNPVS